MESFSTAFRNLLFSSFLSFFSSPSIRRKGSRSRGTVTSSDSVGRHQSDRGTGRENRSAVLHTAKPLFYFAGPNSVALIHPLYTILPFLLFPPLSPYFPTLFISPRSTGQSPGWEKTRDESKQSSIDNVCAVRLTVRIVFPRSPSSSLAVLALLFLSLHMARTMARESTHAHTSSQLTPPLFSLFVSVLVWPGRHRLFHCYGLFSRINLPATTWLRFSPPLPPPRLFDRGRK